ncbi:MAG: ABC transporter substrate-binding protein [Thermodesulfobacteriota bacterium]
MSKHRFLSAAVLVAFGLSLLFSNFAWAADEYRVGCAFAITGKASWLGEPQRATVEMIQKQINDSGGINGKKLVLFIEDTHGENTRAVNAIKKLVQRDKVAAIIGPSRSGTSMAAIPQVTRAGVPMISCAAAEAITTPVAQRKWVFKVAPNDSDAVRRIYEHMQTRGLEKVGLITGTTGFGNAGREQLKGLAAEYAIEIVADETYSPGDTDMTAQLVGIKNAGAQAVINWSIVPAQSIVPQNMRQLNLGIPLYQSHGFANVKYAEAAGEAAEGTLFPAGRIMAVDTIDPEHPQAEALKSYKEAYETATGDQVSTFGGHAYDGLWLVVEALRAVGDDPAKIRDWLETARFTGIGGVFEMSPQDHCGLDKEDFEMLTVKDGKFVVYEP